MALAGTDIRSAANRRLCRPRARLRRRGSSFRRGRLLPAAQARDTGAPSDQPLLCRNGLEPAAMAGTAGDLFDPFHGDLSSVDLSLQTAENWPPLAPCAVDGIVGKPAWRLRDGPWIYRLAASERTRRRTLRQRETHQPCARVCV